LLAESNLVLERVEIYTLARVAVSDGVDVFFRVPWVHSLLLWDRLIGTGC